MTVQNHLTEQSAAACSISFWLKEAQNLFSIKVICIEMKEKSLAFIQPKELPLNLEPCMGDFGHCINKEISCLFSTEANYTFE
jgi:hypothetical protein